MTGMLNVLCVTPLLTLLPWVSQADSYSAFFYIIYLFILSIESTTIHIYTYKFTRIIGIIKVIQHLDHRVPN